jgi:beta-mannosidase
MTLKSYKASGLEWNLTGYIPFEWEMGGCSEVETACKPDINTIGATVPGSVQKALLEAGISSDWNIGSNAREIEWVENRHWLYETKLPDKWFESGKKYNLRCAGLDHKGKIYLNGECIYDFSNCHIEHCVELTSGLGKKDNVLQIMFECPPRWLGQFYWSSKIRDWKPRFYYTWDWTSRLVQVGICDEIYLEEIPENRIEEIYINTDYDIDSRKGSILLNGSIAGVSGPGMEVKLYDHGKVVFSESVCSTEFQGDGSKIEGLDVEPWWPNGQGSQKLYDLEIRLVDKSGQLIDECKKTIGFKHVKWHDCLDTPEGAGPWICNVNGKDVFLQGVNWTPIRPNFADVTEDDYKKRLELYKSIGINVLRVWGGHTLEKSCFYNMCDELGLMVWQEMPLSSSGIENYPPDDEVMVEQYLEIVGSYILRRQHHASVLLWSGGNELTSVEGVPLGLEHPMFKGANEFISRKDPQHRFIPTSPSGQHFVAKEENFGKGEHWDIHGPWKVGGELDENWLSYWQNDDALFRSELGAPGPSSAELIRKYAGEHDVMPGKTNSLWQRTGWWSEIDQYVKENGCKPKTLEDYVTWGQQRQAKILTTAVEACKNRFPRCGGVILWMGHDSFPCTANTSIVDFEGNPKYCVEMLAQIFK